MANDLDVDKDPNDWDVDRDLERVRSSDAMSQSEYEQAGGKTELSFMRCTSIMMNLPNFDTSSTLLSLKFSDYGVEISGQYFYHVVLVPPLGQHKTTTHCHCHTKPDHSAPSQRWRIQH